MRLTFSWVAVSTVGELTLFLVWEVAAFWWWRCPQSERDTIQAASERRERESERASERERAKKSTGMDPN
jgi:hypothetical protein